MNGLQRVVITGLGVCSPLGLGAGRVWDRLVAGESGLVSIDSLPNAQAFKGIPSRVVGCVPRGKGEGLFCESEWIEKWERKTMNLAAVFAIASASESLLDAGLVAKSNLTAEEKITKYHLKDINPERIGISLGMGMVDMEDIYEQGSIFHASGHRRVSPYFIPRSLINMAASHISMRFGLQGPSQAQSTACTTGLHAVGDAAWIVSRGSADVMVAGGAEAPIHPIGLAGFSQVKALSTKFNHSPSEASRPFDRDREGFVMGEGSAVVVVESLAHALSRGAPTIYGEVLGYGMSSDAHHLTAPSRDGAGAVACMTAALRDARLQPDQVGHINAHATSTPLGDSVENLALKKVFGAHAPSLLVSATKASTGHLLGAAGALEAIFAALAAHRGVAPPTLNLLSRTAEFDLDYVPLEAKTWPSTAGTGSGSGGGEEGSGGRRRSGDEEGSTDHDGGGAARSRGDVDERRSTGGRGRVALTNSYGFGGTNASLCIGQYLP